MAIKKPSQRLEKPDVTAIAAERLAQELAEKPYGATSTQSNSLTVNTTENYSRTTISLPKNLLRDVEDLAIRNKRSNSGPKNTSAVIRDALESYLSSQ